MIYGRDEIVRGAILRAGKNDLERAVQHLYPMELKCDRYERSNSESNPDTRLNPDAPIFKVKRNAAIISSIRINDQLEQENSIPIVEN